MKIVKIKLTNQTIRRKDKEERENQQNKHKNKYLQNSI